MKQPVVLRIYDGDKLKAVRQFENSQIVIGRNREVHLDLDDEAVALLHAMIEDREGEYYLSDLGSQSGTFKRGARILEDKLVSGDEFNIGPYRVQFFLGVPKPVAPPVRTEPDALPGLPPLPETISTPLSFSTAVTETPLPSATKNEPVVAPPVTAAKREQSALNKSSTGLSSSPAAVGRKTFAPSSQIKDLNKVLKPYKGSVVEVIVAWKDRILSTNHFREKGSVFISSNTDADVIVPIIASRSRYELLKLGPQTLVCLTPEMSGELIRDGEVVPLSELSRQNKLRNVNTHFELELRQGEMVRVGLQDNLISIYVRYVTDSPKPLVAPLLDMTSSEVTGVILALAISAIMALYMNIYTPTPLLEDEAKVEEPIRRAIVRFNPPRPREIIQVEDTPEEKKVVVVKEKQRATPAPSEEKKGDPGKAAQVAPTQNKNKEKKLTSVRPGKAIKVSNKEGSNMQSERPDPSRVGLLGAFASKGTQEKLDKAYSGSGELAGMAESATGSAGNAENRAGDNFGTKLKDTGAGGKGSQTVGIAGVGTQGRGTGTTGYGTGGIGKKGAVQINVEGQDGEFFGGMDKEAIRRVIREHKREIRNCYEKELQRSPELYGKLVLEWDIEEGGRVSRCVVKSNALANDAVAACVTNHLKTWKFPDPPKDMVGRVSFPFVFSSQ